MNVRNPWPARCLILLLSLQVPGLVAAEARVQPRQSVVDLLGVGPESTLAPAPAVDPSATVLKLGLWAGGIFLAAVGLLVLRRYRKRAGVGILSEGIEVIGRTMISPRHSVLVLRMQGKRVALAIAGDRVTPLGLWDDSTAVSMVAEKSAPVQVPERAGGFTIRPQDREAQDAARRFRDSDLQPYRQQVERLRGLLRGLKSNADEMLNDEEPRQ